MNKLTGNTWLVCGGRDFRDAGLFGEVMDLLERSLGCPALIIHGGAKGADAMAEEWANRREIAVMAYPANWKLLGRSAGPIRNQRMLDEGQPDLVIAFPGGRGTADMVRRAHLAGTQVIEARCE